VARGPHPVARGPHPVARGPHPAGGAWEALLYASGRLPR
jgi:hypothetical protein